jgi:hypothetical protein
MSDTFVQRAQDDLANLENDERRLTGELEEVRSQAAKLRAFLEVYAQYAKVAPIARTTAPASHSEPAAAPPSPTKLGLNTWTTGGKMEWVAVKALRQAGHPLEINQLYEEVRAAGIEVGGERPTTNLSSVLSRSNRIKFIRGVGWMLVEWPPPEPSTGFLTSQSEPSASRGQEEPRRGGAGAD